MQEIIVFAVMVVTVSASGVLSPGPLFVGNITYGFKEGSKAGIKMALGHAIVELPLVIFIGIGILSLEFIPELKIGISILGAAGLFVFAGFQAKSIFSENMIKEKKITGGAFFAGVILSITNPFFIIWWMTIGTKIISQALIFWSFEGILIMFLMHVWMDFVWLTIVAAFAAKSRMWIGKRGYKILMMIVCITLVYFGISFLLEIN